MVSLFFGRKEGGGRGKEERCLKETNDRKGKSRYKSAAREKGPSSFTFAEFLNVSLLRDFFGEKKIKSTLFSLLPDLYFEEKA